MFTVECRSCIPTPLQGLLFLAYCGIGGVSISWASCLFTHKGETGGQAAPPPPAAASCWAGWIQSFTELELEVISGALIQQSLFLYIFFFQMMRFHPLVKANLKKIEHFFFFFQSTSELEVESPEPLQLRVNISPPLSVDASFFPSFFPSPPPLRLRLLLLFDIGPIQVHIPHTG